MRKKWVMIGIIMILTITCININFGQFMDLYGAEKVKKISRKPAPAAAAPAPAPAPVQLLAQDKIPFDIMEINQLYEIISGVSSSGGGGGIGASAFSPDGKYFVTSSSANFGAPHNMDGFRKEWGLTDYPPRITVFDSSNFQEIVAKDTRTIYRTIIFTPDSKHFITETGDIYEIESLKVISNIGGGEYNDFDFSNSNGFLATLSNLGKLIKIHEIGSWQKVTEIRPEINQNDSISSIFFTKDGKYLVIITNNHMLRILEVGNWKNIHNSMHNKEIAITSDLKYFAIADDNQSVVNVYDFKSFNFNLIKRLPYSGTIRYISFISNENLLYIYSHYSKQFPPSIYDVGTWQMLRSVNNIKNVSRRWLVVRSSPNEDGIAYLYLTKLYAYDKTPLELSFIKRDLAKLGFHEAAENLTEQLLKVKKEYQNKIDLIMSEAQTALKMLGGPNKDEYETENEYQNRLEKRKVKMIEIQNNSEKKFQSLRRDLANKHYTLVETYSSKMNQLIAGTLRPAKDLKMTVGAYGAETESFPITIEKKGIDTFEGIVKVPRSNARNFKENSSSYHVSGSTQKSLTGQMNLTNVVINNPDTGENYYLAKTSENLGEVAALPPNLTATVEFYEPSGYKALNAEETGKLIVRIKNSGKGSAYQVVARLIPTDAIADLSYDHEKIIPEIGPGTEQDITFSLKAGLDLPAKQVQFKVDFEEKNGLPPNPAKISFQTRSVLKPNLQIIDYMIENYSKDGIIKPEEVTKMTFRIQNKGQGQGRNVNASVSLGNNIFPALNIPLKHELGDIKPNQVKEFTIAFYANQKVMGKLPLKVDITEERGRFNTEKQYALIIGSKEKTVFEANVSAKELKAFDITELEESSDLEQNIPSTGIVNKSAVAVVIGNYDYKNIQKVSFARRDALAMKEYLIKAFGFDPGNIIFLSDATLGDIVNAFGSAGAAKRSKLSNYLRPGSEIFVYYTGHGAPGLQDKKGYLVPIDADPNNIETTGYSLETLYKNLESLNASKLTIVIDACFSGNSQAGMIFKDASPIMVQAKTDKLQRGTLITSSSGDQISSWYPEKKHSLFTYFFLKGIKEKASKKETIVISDLKDYVSDEVDRISKRLYNRIQTPGFDEEPGALLIDFGPKLQPVKEEAIQKK